MDTSSAKTPTPLTPHDPARGLPQLVRPRGFSSDFSEDGEGGGSHRNSMSDSMSIRGSVSEGAPIRTPDFAKHNIGNKVGGNFEESERKKGNVFEAAFRNELSKSDVTHSEKLNVEKLDEPISRLDKQDPTPATPVSATRQLPPLRLMNSNNESNTSVFPTQQPPLSPLLRSPPNIHSIRQGLPILSPLRAPTGVPRLTTLGTSMVSPPMHPPTLKTSVDSSSGIPIGAHPNIPIKAPQITPITAHPVTYTQESQTQVKDSVNSKGCQYYPLPGSPQKVLLKEFHVSTEKLTVSRRSKSVSLTPPPPDVASPLDSEGVAYERRARDSSSPISSDTEKFVVQSSSIEQLDEKQSGTPPNYKGASPIPSPTDKHLQEADDEDIAETVEELERTSKEAPPFRSSVEGQRTGVGLDESLSRLSDSESSVEPEDVGHDNEETISRLNNTISRTNVKHEDESEKIPSSVLSSISPVSSPIHPVLLTQSESTNDPSTCEESNLEQDRQEKNDPEESPLRTSDPETAVVSATNVYVSSLAHVHTHTRTHTHTHTHTNTHTHTRTHRRQ